MPRPKKSPALTASAQSLDRRQLFAAMAAAFRPVAKTTPMTTTSPLDRLVQRTTLGATPADYAFAASWGYDDYLKIQLYRDEIDDSASEALVLSRCPVTAMTSAQLWAWSDVAVNGLMEEAVILRGINSKHGLYQRMVEFFSDHFNLFSGKPGLWNLYPVAYRDAIRKHALGSFRDLLKAISSSAAMLYYLDNQLSTASAPNENFARELLELHTLGVDNGYTQQDVIEVARCFTGWTVHSFGSQPTSGTFFFDPAIHDNGSKTVLGHAIPAGGGIDDGWAVLDILASHPNTARFMSRKLAQWFISDDVDERVVEDIATIWAATDGDLIEVMKVVLKEGYMEIADDKFKRPFHLFVSALRVLSVTYSIYGLSNQRARFSGAGHGPFQWAPPNGAPQSGPPWMGNMASRWNYFGELIAGVIWDSSVNLTSFFQNTPTAQDVVDRIDQEVFANRMDAADKADVLGYLLAAPLTSSRKNEALTLAFSSPAFGRF